MTIDQLTAAQVSYLDPIPFRDVSVTSAANSGATKKATAYNFSNVANVLHFGALNDGTAGAAAGINSAIDHVSDLGGGTVFIPGGTYTVSGTSSDRIKLKSNVHLVFGGGVEINSGAHGANSTIIAIDTANQATIENVFIDGNGAVINGNRVSTYVQYGISINAQNTNDVLRNITVRNLTINDCRTDSFTIAGNVGIFPEDITIDGVTCDNAHRTGASLIQGKRVRISGCTFKNTNGEPTSAGFDLEPDPGLLAEDISFYNCIFSGNDGNGLYAQGGNGETNGVSVVGCHATENVGNGIVCTRTGHTVVSACRSESNSDSGIIGYQCDSFTISGCVAQNNTVFGILSSLNTSASISGCSAITNDSAGFSISTGGGTGGPTVCTGCMSYGNGERGFNLSYASNILLSGCYSALNLTDGIQLYQSNNCTITGCTVEGNVQSGDLNGDNIIVESNSGFNHIIGNTIRQCPRFFAGTATAGGSTTVTLPATRNVTDDDFYNGMTVRILSGTGSGQTKTISDYVAATGVVTVGSAWSTNPDATSVLQITLAARPRYGIRINAANTENKVTDNDVYFGGATASFSDAGASTVTTSANRT